MKKFLLGCVGGVALISASSAFAADLPTRPVYKAAPMAEALYDWSGLYVGGHIGYGWGRTDISDRTLFGLFAGIPTQRIDSDGFLGGVQAGWNYQFGRFVLGSEVTFSWSDINGSETSPFFVLGNITRTSKMDWVGTATTRLGVSIWDRTLVYSKIGAAWGHFKYNDNVSVPGVGSIYDSSASETRTGWTVGTGIEWAFLGGWSAKAEYNYMDFGRRTVDFASVGPIPVNLDIDQRVSIVTVGLNYRFGMGMGPVVAKY
jgi:outer membrane immunogenic protein